MTRIKHLKELAKSGGICGFLLLIRPLIYLLFSRGRDPNSYAAIDLTAIIFILYSFVCIIEAIKVLSKSNSFFGKKVMLHTPLIWFIIYTIYGFISMLWSVNFMLSGVDGAFTTTRSSVMA